jgi:hypothetical protein
MDEEIQTLLVKHRTLFERVSCELAYLMFNTRVSIVAPWTVSLEIVREHDYIFSLISENERFRNRTIIGANQAGLNAFIGEELSLIEAKDALGEYANIHCALLLDNPDFVESVGFIKQKPPEDSIGLGFFPQAWALHGYMACANQSIYFAFAVENQKIIMDVLDSLDSLSFEDI